MDENNKKNELPENQENQTAAESNEAAEGGALDMENEEKRAFPTEGDEFPPEDFRDEPQQEPAPEAVAEPANQAKANPLPWFLFAASLIAIAVILYMGQAKDGGLGGAAAKVNGEEITKQQVYDILFKQGGEGALDSLITDKLVEQDVAKKKVQINDADVDAELKTIRDRFGSDEEFDTAMKQNGYTMDSLKKGIRQQLGVSKLFESQMDLSEDKLKEYFDKNRASYDTAEQLEVSHILIEKKEDADKALAELKGGADFAAVAKEKSLDTSNKDNGGSLGFIAKGQGYDPAFEEAAFKLNKGELSGVVQSSFGYHIIKVTDKKEAVQATFEGKKEEVRKNMVNEEVQTKANEWLEGLRKEAKIEKL